METSYNEVASIQKIIELTGINKLPREKLEYYVNVLLSYIFKDKPSLTPPPAKKPPIKNPIKTPINCVICLNDIEGEKKVTPCMHVFHASCLDGWVKTCLSKNRDPTCPVCRFKLNPTPSITPSIQPPIPPPIPRLNLSPISSMLPSFSSIIEAIDTLRIEDSSFEEKRLFTNKRGEVTWSGSYANEIKQLNYIHRGAKKLCKCFHCNTDYKSRNKVVFYIGNNDIFSIHKKCEPLINYYLLKTMISSYQEEDIQTTSRIIPEIRDKQRRFNINLLHI